MRTFDAYSLDAADYAAAALAVESAAAELALAERQACELAERTAWASPAMYAFRARHDAWVQTLAQERMRVVELLDTFEALARSEAVR
jgi:hypothetical protein